MIWLIYVGVGVLAYSVYYILSRVFLKEKTSDAVVYALLFNIVCSVLVGGLAISHNLVLPDFHKYWLNLFAMGVLYALGQVFIFRASQLTEASEVIIISSTRIIWAIAAAMLFLGEAFTLYKSIGSALIIFAVILVAYQKTTKKKKQPSALRQGRIYALLAGVCLGIGFVNDSYILRNSDATSYAALVFIIPTIFTYLIYRPSVSTLKKHINLKLLSRTFVLGVVYSVGIIASYAAYQNGGQASQIVPLGQSVVVLTVIFSVVFLSERDFLLRKLLGTAILVAGVLMLI